MKIITHAGQAHVDDLMATAILLTKFPDVEVHRVSSVSERDLNDPMTIVVDIGNEYNPSRNNFDHHHDRNLPCSLVLILQQFFPEIPTDIDELQWINDWDTKGIIATQRKWGVKLPEFRDPLSEMVLRLFSKAEIIRANEWLHMMLRAMGKEFLKFLKEQAIFIEKAKNAEVFEVKSLKVVKLDENVPIRFVKKVHENVAVTIQPNQREPGKLTVTRIDDHPRVDFNRVRNMQGVSFVHPNGFMAVVEPEIVMKVLEHAIE